MKNFIIAVLMVIILNMQEGWQCEGFERALISVLLTICLTGVICLIDSSFDKCERCRKQVK